MNLKIYLVQLMNSAYQMKRKLKKKRPCCWRALSVMSMVSGTENMLLNIIHLTVENIKSTYNNN